MGTEAEPATPAAVDAQIAPFQFPEATAYLRPNAA